MATGPKTNLHELHRKYALNSPAPARPAPATPLASGSKSKFKPARSIPPSDTPSNVTVRKLPSFSTPGFNKTKPALPATPSHADNSNLSIVSISSTESTPLNVSTSSIIPVKRISSGSPHDLLPQTSPKRPKTNHIPVPEKENWSPHDPSGKGKASAREPERASAIAQSYSQSTSSSGGTQAAPTPNHLQSALFAGGADALRTAFNGLPHDADLEEMSEEELRGVCTTADALIEFCNKQVGAARADAGDPRDVLLCNLLTDYLEKRVARARALLKAIQRGERPAAGRARINTNPGPSHTSLPNPSRIALLSSVLAERTNPREQADDSFAFPVAGPSTIKHAAAAAADLDEDDYWGPSDDGFPDIEDPVPPAVPTPATPPASQRGSRAVSATRENTSSGPPPANPIVPDSRDLKEKPYYPKVKEILTSVFRLHSFRALQLKAICTAMDGGDVFVLFPTGSGKSLTFQLPAVCQDGLTVVVSPLKSLIMDQQRALKQLGIDVEVLLGEMPEADKARVWQRLRNGTPPKLLYLTPEMLQISGAMENALTRLRNNGQLKRFVIDEAHLITDWGLTFRDSYAHLSQLRIVYPGVPISAMTGTANAQVQRDIISRLRLTVKEPFKLSFNRPNLDYDVRLKKKNVLEDIATFIREHHPRDTGIIYCSSRDRCEEVAKSLRERYNLNVRHYHAQMVEQDKSRVQHDWSSGRVQIIVATIAFGMGIDKADVRYVIHHDMPSCLNGYYQETGRAGRDGKYARCILYYNSNDYHTWISRIRKDQALTPDLRCRQEGDARRVYNYCMDNVNCRRKQVLGFFDESFNAELCRKMCDNCRDESPRMTEDHTEDAQQTLRLFENLTRGRSKDLTSKQLALALKGNKPQTMVSKGFTSDPLYGVGSKWKPEIIDRLIEEMLNADILATQIKKMPSGYNQTYLLFGPRADALKAGMEKVILSFRMTSTTKKPRGRAGQDVQMENDPAPPVAGPSTAISVQSAAQTARVSRKAPTPARHIPKPKEPEISLYRDDSDDDPEFVEDEIEDISSPPPPARRTGTRGIPSASQRMADGWDSEIEEVDPPPYRVTMVEREDVAGVEVEEELGVPERCHEELRTLRDKIINEDADMEEVLQPTTLELLSLMLPNDMESLRRVLEMEGIAADDIKPYCVQILSICSRYYMLSTSQK